MPSARFRDLYDRSIVAWVFSRKQDDALGSRTLQLLSFRKLSLDVILHTDRGSIYTSNSFRETCRLMGIRQSFSRPENCHDNPSMESFNGTFKEEALYNQNFENDSEPTFMDRNSMIERYIDFYNHLRPCSVIQNRVPMEYRMSFMKTQRPTAESGIL